MGKSFDRPGEKQKISDKDSQSNLTFTDVMPDDGSGALITKADQIKTTQSLVEKRILAPLTIVRDDSKGNPLKGRTGKKKKSRALRELAKFDEELLSKIPTEKLAQLLEMQSDDRAGFSADSFKEEVKKLLQSALAEGEILDVDESKPAEVLSPNVTGSGGTVSQS